MIHEAFEEFIRRWKLDWSDPLDGICGFAAFWSSKELIDYLDAQVYLESPSWSVLSCAVGSNDDFAFNFFKPHLKVFKEKSDSKFCRIAVWTGKIERLNWLVSEGEYPPLKNKQLCVAIRENNLDAVRTQIGRFREFDDDVQFLFDLAASLGYVDILKLLKSSSRFEHKWNLTQTLKEAQRNKHTHVVDWIKQIFQELVAGSD